jgi:hypothetical protein
VALPAYVRQLIDESMWIQKPPIFFFFSFPSLPHAANPNVRPGVGWTARVEEEGNFFNFFS